MNKIKTTHVFAEELLLNKLLYMKKQNFKHSIKAELLLKTSCQLSREIIKATNSNMVDKKNYPLLFDVLKHRLFNAMCNKQ